MGVGQLVDPNFAVGAPYPCSGVLMNPDLRVSDLINQYTRSWHHAVIDREVSAEDHHDILDTPIGGANCMDMLVWLADKMRRYTVKFGYHWIHVANRRVSNYRPPHHRWSTLGCGSAYGTFGSLQK